MLPQANGLRLLHRGRCVEQDQDPASHAPLSRPHPASIWRHHCFSVKLFWQLAILLTVCSISTAKFPKLGCWLGPENQLTLTSHNARASLLKLLNEDGAVRWASLRTTCMPLPLLFCASPLCHTLVFNHKTSYQTLVQFSSSFGGRCEVRPHHCRLRRNRTRTYTLQEHNALSFAGLVRTADFTLLQWKHHPCPPNMTSMYCSYHLAPSIGQATVLVVCSVVPIDFGFFHRPT